MWRKPRETIAQTRGSPIEREQSGQSLVIIAMALFGLLVIAGLAVDLGLMYIERIRLGRACDAAALAGAQELPLEAQAAERAKEYLEENGYNLDEYDLTVIGPEGYFDAADVEARGEFIIRAHAQEDPDFPEPTDLLSVEGTVNVPMSFMALIGFREVPVQAYALAENVLKRLDVAIVYDSSGSMNDDSYCFSCLNKDNPLRAPGPECYGCWDPVEGEEYPDGARMFLPYPHEFCEAQQPVIRGGYDILVSEAEWYSYSTSIPGGENDYTRTRDTSEEDPPNSFWMLQRVQDSQASGHRYAEDDRRGAHLMHMPNLIRMLGHQTIDNAPRLDYDMDLTTPGNWYVWIRAQCGPWPGDAGRADGCLLHWGANGSQISSISSADFGTDGDLQACICDNEPCACRPPQEGGARGSNWTWVRLGSVNTPSRELQINLWGGGMAFRLDKILLTRNPEGPSNSSQDRAPRFIRDTTPSWGEVRPLAYQSYQLSGRYGGPPDTGGRNGLACDVCNPLYGLEDEERGCNNRLDDGFDDAQPIRAAQEAAKSFVRRLRARFDQVAFVEYATESSIVRELNCVWQRDVPPVEYGPGVWDPEAGPDDAWVWCFDHRDGTGGYEGPPSEDLDDGSVIYAIESMVPEVWTNIAEGLDNGIQVILPGPGHYGRPYAARYIILLTDGVPNRWPNYRRDHECHTGDSKDLWPAEGYEDASRNEDEAKARDCTIYFADEARRNGIAVFTIGLGINVDDDLLTEVARRTGGSYFAVTSGEELNAAFEEIANRMILRLVE